MSDASNDTHRVMNYTIELTNDEGDRLIAGLKANNAYGDGRALGVIQEAVSAGRLTATPTAFHLTMAERDEHGYCETVRIPEIES